MAGVCSSSMVVTQQSSSPASTTSPLWPTRVAQAADWPRLAEVWGKPEAWAGAERSLRRASWPRLSQPRREPAWFQHRLLACEAVLVAERATADRVLEGLDDRALLVESRQRVHLVLHVDYAHDSRQSTRRDHIEVEGLPLHFCELAATGGASARLIVVHDRPAGECGGRRRAASARALAAQSGGSLRKPWTREKKPDAPAEVVRVIKFISFSFIKPSHTLAWYQGFDFFHSTQSHTRSVPAAVRRCRPAALLAPQALAQVSAALRWVSVAVALHWVSVAVRSGCQRVSPSGCFRHLSSGFSLPRLGLGLG